MDTRGGAPQFCLLMFSGLMWFIKPATLSSTHPVHPATGIVRYEVAEKCVEAARRAAALAAIHNPFQAH